MKLSITAFRGIAPKITPRLLPGEAGQQATNARVLTGDLTPWRDLKDEGTLGKSGPIIKLQLLLNKFWLCWRGSELGAGFTDIDVATIPAANTTDDKAVVTGLGVPMIYTAAGAVGNPETASKFGAYPLALTELGVQAPTAAPTVTSVQAAASAHATTFTYDGSSFADWTPVEQHDHGWNSNWYVANTQGNPAPSWHAQWNHFPHIVCVAQKDFGVDISTQFILSWDGMIASGSSTAKNEFAFCGVYSNPDNVASMPRLGFSVSDGTFSIVPTAGFAGQTISGIAFAYDTQYHITATCIADKNSNGDVGFMVTATITGNQNAVDETISNIFVPYLGANFAAYGRHEQDNESQVSMYWDNITIVVQQAGDVIIPVESAYVYTRGNSLGFESAPSPLSVEVQVDNGYTNTVTIPAQVGTTYPTVYLYRAATSATGATELQLVTSFDNVSLTDPIVYADSISTSALGEVLQSTDFLTPPVDGQGVISLPNQIVAMYSGKTLYLSDQGFPQSYPLLNQRATDSAIVGLGAIDTTVLIITEGRPYTAYGDDPVNYTMTKEEFSQGGTSHRSIAFLRGYGIVYASTDGIYAYAGQGNIKGLTEALITRREWEALDPTSIIGAVHQNLYFFWYTALDGKKGGYILDPSPNGFGLVEMDFHPLSVYNNSIDDILYLVLDAGVIEGGATPANNQLVAFDQSTDFRAYIWKSKLYQLEKPAVFRFIRVRLDDYSTVPVLTLFADGVGYYQVPLVDDTPLILKAPPTRMRTFEFSIAGTATVETIELGERIEDLLQ